MGVAKVDDPQLEAIQSIDRNLAVNAGAGTGKTKVLTERFVYILEHGKLEEFKEVESIVAITFTNKATQEMIERIRGEIKKKFHLGEKWKRFYRDLEKANISTIHGFCSKILKENPIESGIDPYFEILDEDISSELLEESILQVLSTGLEKDENIFKMLRALDRNRIESMVDDFLQIYNKIRTIGIDMNEVKENTIANINSFQIKDEEIQEIKSITSYLMDNLSKASKISKLKQDPVWQTFQSGDYEAQDIFYYMEYIQDNIGNSSKEVDKQDRLKSLIASVLLGKEKDNLWLYETILDILIQIDHRYSKLKEEAGGLDYDDLQIMVLKLLDNREIRQRYQKKFRYFMIDEFQDTNELQKKIFYRLTSVDSPLDRENLFVVGDPKQSIYGFRGADIDVFYDVLDDIEKWGQDNIITLDKNYRSKDTILEFINSIFMNLMGDRYDRLFAHNVSENDVDVEIIQKEDVEKIDGIDENTLANIYESKIIAGRIRELVESGRYTYGDFAILFRATTRSHIYEKALKKLNIPYYNSSSKGYFYRQEVIDLINAIKTISNPYDTIATIGFLRGPMVGLRDDTIYWLLRNREVNIYNTMAKMKDNPIIASDEREKLKDALEIMDYFFDIKDIYDIWIVIEKIVEKTLFIEVLLSRPDGEQSIANIYKFIDMAKDYNRENRVSLEEYIDYLERKRLGSEGEGVIQSAKDDVVKIMTIHGSKGLQFPVVIIPEMTRGMVMSSPTILFHKDMGIGIRTKDTRVLYDIMREEQNNRETEEMKRVFYVAMTRAKSLLILGNQGKNRGFKSMIQNFMDENQYSLIEDIEIPQEKDSHDESLDSGLLLSNKGYKNILEPNFHDLGVQETRIFERYNISQYLSFRDCKRRFFIDHYWKLNMDIIGNKVDTGVYELTGSDKGNIVHEFCHMYRHGMDEKPLLEDIVKSHGILFDEKIYGELYPYIYNYISNYSEEYDKIYSERPFHIKLGDSYLVGVIDRIIIDGSRVEVWDFKTNRLWNKNHLIHYYSPQLQLYAYVVEKIFGKRVDAANIIFLENGERESVDISAYDLEKNIDSIVKFMRYVTKNKTLEDYPKSIHCNLKCPHVEFCNLI